MAAEDADRAQAVIRSLDLLPHPEGGHYREGFRSPQVLDLERGERSSSTAIWFLLQAGEVSRWHRIRADEVWHWYEGHPVALLMCPAPGTALAIHHLGPLAGASRPQIVVPAGWWQAARPLGAYALMGCTVAPGFCFDDFALLDPAGPAAVWFRGQGGADLVDGPT